MFKKENKIIDLSAERKKREKEIEEARKKMNFGNNLKVEIIKEKIEKISKKSKLKEFFNLIGFLKIKRKQIKEKKLEQKVSEKNEPIIRDQSKKLQLLLKLCNSFISVPIYLLVFFIPLFFLPFTFEIFEFNKQYLLWFLVTIALIAWLIKMAIIKKGFKFLRNPLNIPVLILMIIFALATFFSLDRYSSIWGVYGWFSGNLLEILSLGMLFFIIINNINETNLTINRLKNVFLCSGFFVILISCLSIFGFLSKGIAQISWLNNFVSEINLSNFNSIGSWETLSIYLVIIIILILGKKPQNLLFIINNYSLLVICCLLLIGINFTLAWIVLSITIGLFFVFKIVKKTEKENSFKIYLISIIFIIAFISIFYPLNKFIKIDLNKEVRLENKISWQITADTIKHHPILGTGPSTFIYNFSKYHSAEFNQNKNWQIRFGKSGNYISELIVSIGILGILVYLILMGILFKNIFRLPFTIYCFPVFSLFIAQFFYQGNTVLNFCFWFFLSLLIADYREIKPEIFKYQKIGYKILKNVPEFSIILNLVIILIFFILIGGGYFAVQKYKAEVLIKYGLKSKQPMENFYEQKIEILKQALILNSEQVYYQINLIQAYLDKISNESLILKNQQSYEKMKETVSLGIDQIKKVQKIAPFNIETAEVQGRFYKDIETMTEGTIPLAIEGVIKAIELEPNSPVLHLELGKMYADLAEKNKEKDLEKESQKTILEKESFIEKIKKMSSSELIALAQKEFQKALELKKNFWPAELYLSLSYEKQGDVKKAISGLEKITIDLDKEKKIEPIVLFELGRLYFNQEKTDEAIKIFQIAIQISPNYSNALYGLAIAYEKKELYDQASQIFLKLQELNPNNKGIERKLLELKAKNN